MSIAVARAYNGGLGAKPKRDPGAKPLVRGSGVFGRSTEAANLPSFLKFGNAKK